jgi:hypothetical protein
MRVVVFIALVVSAAFAAMGCTPVRYEGHVAHGDPTGDQPPPEDDAGMGDMPMQDAAFAGHDAGHTTTPVDAWVRPGDDAWVAPQPDAWVAPQPDAWTMPACPTFAHDVEPIYVMHCANCHTTGGDPHFGSSYSVAASSSSSCGGTMADCTIQLGSPGGSMAYRDPYGGFSDTEIQTIQSWINCNFPR